MVFQPKKHALLRTAAALLRKAGFSKPKLKFQNSAQYWNDRYKIGGTSGSGSYGHLAAFKAHFLNNFVKSHNIRSVVEYGCGDGAQLSLAAYPEYTGFDVSPLAVELCKTKFSGISTYQFHDIGTKLEREGDYDLAISLDVIYHLVEDDVFDRYMRRLFDSSKEYVIIFAYNFNKTYDSPHERGREFVKWCHDCAPVWKLVDIVKNPHPYNERDPNNTSQSDFFVFRKAEMSRSE